MKDLTERQKEVLAFIADYFRTRAYPPTVREVADHLGVSVKGAYDHLTALKRKGRLNLGGKRSRTMSIIRNDNDWEMDGCVRVPILSAVSAGKPVPSEESLDDAVPIHSSMLKKHRQYFAVRVKGDSMKDAGILEKDIAVIQKQNTAKNGEIVVAVVDEAATLKRYYRESNRVRLAPENKAHNPIYSREVKVLGKLAFVIRVC
ncbi:MAG: transcriptional repressor LexA [Treponema sp.]|jgi:repressor LexA|nr:transcriptional repressor LexA [Treponema sp.]